MSYIIKGADDKPILHQGKEIHAMDLTGVVKGVDVEKRLLKMVGTDETRDRDGDVVKLSGWMLENYLKNPVFLWAHDYRSVPLAAAQKVIKKRSSNAMEFHLRFPSQELYPFADMILNLYNEGIINASSVGFIPFKWEDLTDEEKQGMSPMADIFGGRKFTKQELLELSGCAVPSNPNALQNSMAAKGFGVKYGLDVEQISRFIMQSSIHNPIEALGAKSDDVYQELKLDKCTFEDEDDPKVYQVPVQINGVDAKAKLGEIATGDPEVKAVKAPEDLKENVEYNVDFTPQATKQFEHAKPGKIGLHGEYSDEKGIIIDNITHPMGSEEADKYMREHYSKEFGVDLSEGEFAIIESRQVQDKDDGKTVVRYLAFKEGVLQVIKEEVIDSKDLEPGGKAGPVLSRKNRETLTQARDILDEVLKAPLEELAGEENPDKSGAGDTTAEKALQEDLETIKNIIDKINKSFGG